MKKIVVIFLLLASVGCNNKDDPDKVDIKYNKIEETKNVDNLEVSNLNIKVMDGVSEINYKIKNKDINDKNIKEIEMIFKDKKGNEITRFIVNIESILKNKEEKVITTVVDKDLTTSSTYEVIVK